MPKHKVKKGEDMTSLAMEHGLRDWSVLYNHPANSGLRDTRPNPNILLEGDEVWVPDDAKRWAWCRTGGTYTFQSSRPSVRVRVVLEDSSGAPLRDKPYELTMGEEVVTGVTGRDGKVDHFASPSVATATLKVWLNGRDSEPTVWNMELGALEPIDTPEGMQSRLINLGYMSEDDREDEVGEATRAALVRFQKACGLVGTGDPTPRTLERLEAVYGS